MMDRKRLSYLRLIWRLNLSWLIIPLGAGIVLLGVVVAAWSAHRDYQRNGLVAQSEVIAREVTRERNSDGDVYLAYHLTHSFRPEGYSSDVVARAEVGRSLYEASDIGDFVPVTYIWNNPEQNTLTPERNFMTVIFFGLGAIAALTAALIGISLGWRHVASAKRALLQGEVREARITEIRRMSRRDHGKARYRLFWEDAAGNTGKSLEIWRGRAHRHNVGDVIVIYVDPATGRGWWQQQI